MASEDSQYDLSEERIGELPRRALIAFAVRCAKRVQPLYQHVDEGLKSIRAVETAVDLAREYVSGRRSAKDHESRRAELRSAAAATAASSSTAHVAAYAAATDADARSGAAAVRAAAHARFADVVRTVAKVARFAAAAHAAAGMDIQRYLYADLTALENFCGEHGEAKVNLSPRSQCSKALGPLCPEGEPEWYTQGVAAIKQIKKRHDDPELLRREIKNLKAQISTLSDGGDGETEILTLRKDLEEEKSRSHEKGLRLAKAESELADAQRKNESLRFEHELLQSKKQTLVTDLAENQTQHNKTLTELDQVKSKYNHLRPRGWDEWLSALRTPTGPMMALAILGLITTLTILTVAEVNSRNQLLASTRDEIETLELELIATRPQGKDAVSGEDSDNQDLLPKLTALKATGRRLRGLIGTGAVSSSETLAQIRYDFLATEEQREKGWLVGPYRSVSSLLLIGYASSDFLISLVVILAGTIGSIIAAIRKKELLTCIEFGLGLSAGFIAFLVIRGGQDVFLVQATSKASSLNVYSCALFGLIVGLFTDDAYAVLRQLVDKLVKRIKEVVGTEDSVKQTDASSSKTKLAEPDADPSPDAPDEKNAPTPNT